MKEQVSVDECDCPTCRNTMIAISYCIYTNKEVKRAHVELSEHERLKRLDENVKNRIAAYNKCVNGVFGKDYLSKIELLESLYK